MRWSLLGPVRLAWPMYSRNALYNHLKHVADSADLAPHRHEAQGLTRSARVSSADSVDTSVSSADSVDASDLVQALVGHEAVQAPARHEAYMSRIGFGMAPAEHEEHIPPTPTVFGMARALARRASHMTPIAMAQARKARDMPAS